MSPSASRPAPLPAGVSLAVTGDLQLNRPLVGQRTPAPATAAVYDLLRGADLAFANLETPLTNRGAPADKLITFRADPHLAPELAAVGIGVVTIANNHALDYGVEGLRDTLGAVRDAGVPVVGGGETLEESFRPATLEARGVRAAFLGIACTLPPGFAATAERPGIAPIRVHSRYVMDAEALLEQPGTAPFVETVAMAADVERAVTAVRQAREAAGIVVVGIHWGVPHGFVAAFQDPIAQYQSPLAHRLVEAGATVVVGNHPHVLHGMEWYRGALIMYSLGNFLFHRLAPGSAVGLHREYPPYRWHSLRSRVNRLSCLPLIRLATDGPAGVELVPLVLNEFGEPEVAEGDVAAEILTLLDDLCRPFRTGVDITGCRGRLQAGPPE